MKNVYILPSLHFFCFVVLFTIIGGLNYFRDDYQIPLVQISIVITLYLGYSVLISYLILHAWSRRWIKIVVNAIIYLFLTFTFIPFIDFLVHKFLPQFGVVFFVVDLPENYVAFRARLISGYMTANLFAIFACLTYGGIYLLRNKRQLNKDLKQYRDRAVAIKYTSHFLTSVFANKFGEMLINDVPKDKTAKRDIIQFLAYLLEVEQLNKTATIVDEVDHLECFVRLLKMYYGEGTVLYSRESDDNIRYPDIPTGVLFFPLENCLKHANISVEYPVSYKISYMAAGLVVNCHNSWSPKEVLVHSGTGFVLLEAKLAQVDYTSSIDAKQDGGIFSVHLKLNFLN